MFSLPKPIPSTYDDSFDRVGIGSATTPHPQYQSITSPLSSREKGDWGFKRAFPLKSTMASTTPLIRVKQVDSCENVTDFATAAGHTLSLEKFQELRIAMTVPRANDRGRSLARSDAPVQSVFEEENDITDFANNKRDFLRWKFQGPWLAKMTQGEFMTYLKKEVRPQRGEFRSLLRRKLAADVTSRQRSLAQERGEATPPSFDIGNITSTQFTDYMRSLRNDRVTLYAMVSEFLDLAPLGQPVGIVQTFWTGQDKAVESPYGKSGPPPSHPSGGLSYLRTSSFMENHPVYGPQGRRTAVEGRVLAPRAGNQGARLGVGGFVVDTPAGDNEFNMRHGRARQNSRATLKGISVLDTTTIGGAKAYIEPHTATIDPSGRVNLNVRSTTSEAQLLAREAKGQAQVYHDRPSQKYVESAETQRIEDVSPSSQRTADTWRMNRVAEEMMSDDDAGGMEGTGRDDMPPSDSSR